MTSFHDRMHLDDPAVIDRTIFVDCGQVQATDFDLDEASQEMLFDSGRRAAERFLDSWDFDDYIRTYRPETLAARRRGRSRQLVRSCPP
jgi:NTE family protein